MNVQGTPLLKKAVPRTPPGKLQVAISLRETVGVRATVYPVSLE